MSEAHITVMLAEAVEALAIKPSGIYVDATFGRGGHCREILKCLGPQGRLIGLDRDEDAVAVGQELHKQDPRFQIVHTPFSGLQQALDELAIQHVDGILMDLGVSSPQLDEGERGMSFRADHFLDMRMDRSCGETAAAWLARATVAEISNVLRDYGEERYAHAIAKALVVARSGQPVTTTGQLATLVEKAVPTREPGLHPATRTFQAIRIFINRELEELSLVLPQCVERLRAGGRLVVISFHSLEDRIVKRFMRDESKPPQLPKNLPVREADRPPPKLKLVGTMRTPESVEISRNPRARSAKMRVAERTDFLPSTALLESKV